MLKMRNEYPRPQLVRDEWINLNGEWEFEIDNSISGKSKKFYNRKNLDSKDWKCYYVEKLITN